MSNERGEGGRMTDEETNEEQEPEEVKESIEELEEIGVRIG